MQQAPDEVATHADWPVNEADLHARHLWLVRRKPEIRAACMADPDWCDPKAAGWWVWGLSQWIGSGWCDDKALTLQAPRCNGLGGQGIHGAKVPRAASRLALVQSTIQFCTSRFEPGNGLIQIGIDLHQLLRR